jgi:hypothetical protein
LNCAVPSNYYCKYLNIHIFHLLRESSKTFQDAPIQHVQPYITNKLDMTTIPSSYADNWWDISKERKQYYKWKCLE